MKSSPYFQINGQVCGIYVGADGEQGGIVPAWTDRGLEITVYLHCAWESYPYVLRGLRGWVGFDQNGNIVRTDPVSMPINPNQQDYAWGRFICVGTGDIRGEKWRTDQDGSITGAAGWGYYVNAIIPAKFAAPSYQTQAAAPGYGNGKGQSDLSGMPYTTTKIRTSGEVFCPPHGAYSWPNGTPVDEAHVGVIRAKQEIQITRHFMPTIPVDRYQSVVGTVNGKPLALGRYSFPRGTIMFMGCSEIEPYSDVGTGLSVCDITFNLMGNGTDNLPADGTDHTLDFNKVMDPTGSWQFITDANQRGPFPYANLWSVIWPEYYSKGT